MKGIVTLDIETTIAVHMKRKASPYTPDNWVVAIGWAWNKDEPQALYFGHTKEGSRGWLKGLLELEPAVLTGFNIKFDLQHLLKYQEDYEAYQEWIVKGGELWDTQLVEYLLDGMVEDSHMLSLDEVAIRYGGEVKIDEVKAYWARGVSTEHIPRQLLLDYLVGRKLEDGTVRPGDIQNSAMIYYGQQPTVDKRNSRNSMRLNNGALVATIEMERNGLHVDMEVAEAEMVRLREEIAKGEEELRAYYPKDMPFAMNWNSPRHKSAIFFGGAIPYKEKVPVIDLATGKQQYVQKEETHYLLVDGSTMEQDEWDHRQYQTENPAACTCTAGSPCEVHLKSYLPERLLNKSGKMAGMPKTKKVKVDDTDKPKTRIEEFHFSLPGYVKPMPHWKSSAYEGVYSTSKDVMEALEDEDIPFIQAFMKLSKMQKDLSTYYRTDVLDEEGNVVKSTGMLTLVQEDGIVHHTLNQTSTVTGRFSHKDPNSGNLPREGTSNVKKMLTSRWGEHGRIISSDFRSLEVYCQAQLTGDKNLIADLKADIDMHCMRLSLVENKPYEEVLVLAKGDKKKGIASVLEWERKRTDIKVFSFQRAYGAGAAKIAKQVKKDKEVVEEWIAADDQRYSGIPKFNERLANTVARNSVPSKVVVTHPKAKIPLHLNRGHFDTFDGKRYSWLESAAPDFMIKKGVYQSFKPTELKNYPVQGLGGEWMKSAMWIAVKVFYRYKNFGGLALLNNTVHDALYADSHVDVQRKAGMAIHASMLAASDQMEYLFDRKIEVPVPSETTLGISQFEQADFEDTKEFEAKAQLVRTWIRNTFMEGYVPTYLQE